VKFESTLAKKITSKRNGKRSWLVYAGLVGAVFLVLNLNAISIAEPQAVIHMGSRGAVAKYLGQFDGIQSVMMLGATSSEDWICIKVPFKGRIGDLSSISFSEFVIQTGGSDSLEPYVVLKLSQGMCLICKPSYSYDTGVWDLPFSEWQSRDTVTKGKWSYAAEDTRVQIVSLETWVATIGNRQVTSVCVYMGNWDLSSPYQCYIGGLAINEKPIDLANAVKITGSKIDLPPGF